MSALGDIFAAMAERLAALPNEEFGGVIVVVPPADASGKFDPIEVLMVDPRRDAAAFWGMAKSKVDAAHAAFEQALMDRARSGWPMR